MGNKQGMIKMYKMMALVVVSAALTGCLGGKNAPDEMAVIDHAPLTLPPSFELRPPRQGYAPATAAANKKAQDLILGKKERQQQATTTDNWLIEKAGGETRNASIRELMAEESRDGNVDAEKEGWLEGMFSEEKNADPTLEELAEMAKKEK